MKLAQLKYRETCYYDDDNQINKDFVVEYTDDFDEKIKALDEFESLLHEYAYDYDCDELFVSNERFEEVRQYYEGSTITAIESYIYKHFNVIHFVEELERDW